MKTNSTSTKIQRKNEVEKKQQKVSEAGTPLSDSRIMGLFDLPCDYYADFGEDDDINICQLFRCNMCMSHAVNILEI